MKKLISLIISITVFSVLFTFNASAKILEECYHCNATGKFNCPVCSNTGEVICEGCNGEGYSICKGEPGKGCDHGYYTCPSCSGDGKNRTGDGKIVDGVCGNCNGEGKLRCVVCHTTPGINYCDTCGGTGKKECVASNCQDAKAVGWKCPYCVGTGWLHLTQGHIGEINDGVYNVPQNGDIIRDQNGNERVWGKENDSPATTTTAPPENDPPEEKQTQTTQDTKKTDPDGEGDKPPEETGEQTDDKKGNDDPKPPAEIVTHGDTFELSFHDEVSELSDETKAQVAMIVSSCVPGGFGENSESIILSYTGTGKDDWRENRIYPIYFEGHIVLDTPVRVTVKIEDNTLEGGRDIYIYHIREDGTAELLEDANIGWITYESGYIESISFDTKEFSSFFTSSLKLTEAAKGVNTDKEDAGSAADEPEKNENAQEADEADTQAKTEEKSNTGIIIGIVIIAAAVIAVVLFVIIKKKRLPADDKAPKENDDKENNN